jgi:hypothetical protein
VRHQPVELGFVDSLRAQSLLDRLAEIETATLKTSLPTILISHVGLLVGKPL